MLSLQDALDQNALLEFMFPAQLQEQMRLTGRGYNPSTTRKIIHELLAKGIDLRRKRSLDLGSGHGVFVADLAVRNCKAYGIEVHPERISYAKDKFKELPIVPGFVPELLEGDYFIDQDFTFPDGAKPCNMDFFYCFTYNIEHAIAVLAVLSGKQWAQVGSIACIDQQFDWSKKQYYSKRRAVAEMLGFEVFPRHRTDSENEYLGNEYFLHRVKMVDDAAIRDELIRSYTKTL